MTFPCRENLFDQFSAKHVASTQRCFLKLTAEIFPVVEKLDDQSIYLIIDFCSSTNDTNKSDRSAKSAWLHRIAVVIVVIVVVVVVVLRVG